MQHKQQHSNAVRTVLRQLFTGSMLAVPACLLAPHVSAQQLTTLTPNQQATANGLSDVCQRLGGGADGPSAALSVDQLDLFTRCGGVFGAAGASQAAVDEIGAQQFNALRTVSVQFAQNQYQSVMDRLVALRTGQRRTPVVDARSGSSATVAGLEGPAIALGEFGGEFLGEVGGGASADNDERGGLLDNRAGFWTRATYGDGGKRNSIVDAGFRSDQWGATAGFDYRFGKDMVGGVLVGYGESNVSFRPRNQGGFDADALNASAYGTVYLGGIYIDGIFNYIDTDYDTSRRILYNESSGPLLDRNAQASISGRTLNAGVSFGYDFVFGAFTVAPVIGYFYVDGDLESFRERGAGGLDLQFADRDFRSSTGNIGFRASYAWRTPVGVIVPQLRASYIREFDDDVETFKARFANDPANGAATPAAPIVFNGGSVDQSYFKFAAGVSAQFKYDVSGYIEYQRLQSFSFVDFSDLTFGVRMQRGF